MNQKNYTPEQISKIEKIVRHFINRESIVSIMMKYDSPTGNTEKKHPRPVKPRGAIDEIITAHVVGQSAPMAKYEYLTKKKSLIVAGGRPRVGTYAPDKKGLSRWGCIDFDNHDRPSDLKNPEICAIATFETAIAAGLTPYLERSGGGSGFHIWFFFKEKTDAMIIKAALEMIVPQDCERHDGIMAAPGKGGIEIFPKQAIHKGSKKIGNMVWLPWFHDAKPGSNEFYSIDYNSPGVPSISDTPIIPDFEPCDQKAFCALYEQFLAKQKEEKERFESEQAANVAKDGNTTQNATQNAPQANQLSSSDENERTRLLLKSAIAKIDPDCDYNEWVQVGMAVKTFSAGPDGFSIFDEWSQSGAKYKRGETQEKWGSFSSDPNAGISYKSIFSKARDSGGWDFKLEIQEIERQNPNLKKQLVTVQQSQSAQSAQSLQSAKNTEGVFTSERIPQIQVNNRQDSEIIADIWRIIYAKNEKSIFEYSIDDPNETRTLDVLKKQPSSPLFLRAGKISRLSWVKEPSGKYALTLETLSEAQVASILSRIAIWVFVSDAGIRHSRVPPTVLKIIHADPANCGGEKLPSIDSIAETPIIAADGSLISTPGYHAAASIWLSHQKDIRAMRPVKQSPSTQEIAFAKNDILSNLFIDFPFADHIELANAMAALLLPFVRQYIDGPTPLHLIESPTPGTGKTLLANIISIVCTGRYVEPITIGKNDEEIEKRVVSLLLRGRSIILLDNINYTLNSGSLASAITSYPSFSGRMLSRSEIIELKNQSTWLATANNLKMSIEMARRCCRIRIDSSQEMPWERTNFKHENIARWCFKNRSRLIRNCLVMIRAWQAAGEPVGERLGSFESWSEIMGGILAVSKIDGFLKNKKDLYSIADPVAEDLQILFVQWFNRYRDDSILAKDINYLCDENSILSLVRGDGSELSKQKRLANFLKKNRGRVVDKMKLEIGKDRHSKSANFRLVDTESIENESNNSNSKSNSKTDVLDLFSNRN